MCKKKIETLQKKVRKKLHEQKLNKTQEEAFNRGENTTGQQT